MKILDFYPANCKNCYKCVRNCPVKAVKIVNDQAEIMEEKCIACGKCFLVCPQNARNIHSDLANVRNALKYKKVVVSIAPSYTGIYPEPERLVGALYGIGFESVEETAVAAEMVTDLYNRHIESTECKNYITSCCPSVNMMIRKFYPKLAEYLMAIDSPMILHSKVLRRKHGKDAYIVFLGPCISKKCEATGYQKGGIIDAVISFEELDLLFRELDIEIHNYEPRKPETRAGRLGFKYPGEGGILPGIKETALKSGLTPIKVSGASDCMELFHSLVEDDIEGTCIEANICMGGCLGGPAIPKNTGNIFKRTIRANHMLSQIDNERIFIPLGFDWNSFNPWSREFSDSRYEQPTHSEASIKEVLKKMGKINKEDELNCGACGYDTCREKSKAVLEGISHLEMCIPHMRMKAERLSNIIFEVSPNILMLLDEEMKVVDINPQGEKTFHTTLNQIKGKGIGMIMTPEDFEQVINKKENILGKKISVPHYNLKLKEYLIYIEEHKLVFGLFSNVTDEERRNEELSELKFNTLSTVNNVIDRQMRVAQEIAGLLGETTAEAKIAL
ncbi:MAG: [Fe-Fe] hydrogenase large subunit C-terminal domain-containing protein, partial [Eubacteriales bacterium]|nr:[Fe-Fe] hydrogenase large subunit C-terminal domain-containing protein [Eubacteriales bacterium]